VAQYEQRRRDADIAKFDEKGGMLDLEAQTSVARWSIDAVRTLAMDAVQKSFVNVVA